VGVGARPGSARPPRTRSLELLNNRSASSWRAPSETCSQRIYVISAPRQVTFGARRGVTPSPAARHRGSARAGRLGGQCAGCRLTSRNPWITQSMSASSKGMLCTIWRCTLSWIVAVRAWVSIATGRQGAPSLHHFSRMSPSRTGGSILLVVGFLFKFARLGVERHERLEDVVVHR
jgi:hypothetical protein